MKKCMPNFYLTNYKPGSLNSAFCLKIQYAIGFK